MGYLDSNGLETQVGCIKKYVKAETGLVREELRNRANIPIGFEYFTMNPNVPQGSLPLFGGEYSRDTYSALWDWVQEQTGYLKTESEWQDLSTAHNGNVPYYSDGDGSTTFRVPSLKCWIKGANGTVTEVGSYLEAGIPNITGALTPNDTTSSSVDIDFTGTGAVRATNASRPSGSTGTSSWMTWAGFNIDASRSSSVYGKSSTVQPESIVGMWLVKAYGTIEDTGTIDEQQYIDDRIAAEVTRTDGKFLPLAGGTMSGAIVWSGTNLNAIKRDNGNDGVCIIGGNTDNFSGATLQLFGQTQADYAGRFYLRASTRSNVNDTSHPSVDLAGYPNGSLTWGGKEVERVNSESLTHNSGYVRYENGLQICWGTVGVNTQYAANAYATRTWTYPVAFKLEPVVFCNSRHDRFNVGTNNSPIGTASCTIYSVNTSTSSAFTLSYIDCVAVGTWK